METSEAMNAALKNIPKALAAGIVDMESGFVIDMKTTESHPQEILELLSAATKELYEGETVMEIEQLFKRSRGVKTEAKYFKEIIIYSENLIHFFTRLQSNPAVVFAVITQVDTNIGLVVLKGKQIAKEINL